ncbi:phosphotransferase [Streptomyces sp. NPDC102340]|uniref:phosphotransferase n=1 Tax=unclassified Streptomyces TaxID=2593676 RepID=UPI003812C65E
MTESPLPGGSINAVVRVGDTVRRPASPEFTRDLLRWFEARGWRGAPRHHGSDDEGRDALDFLDGHVAWEPRQPAAVSSDESLVALARLVRTFHDLTAGTELAGAEEVVCHNDLSPKNTVYRPADGALRPVAFIDWDLAAPGRRIHDVAHACWQYLGLGPSVTDAEDATRRMRLIADAYGLTDRSELVATMLWWQDRCWRGIQAGADSGDAAMMRLRDTGAVDEVRGAYEWVRERRIVLERALD